MLKRLARLILPRASVGYELPHDNWFTYLHDSSKFTPDIAKLEQYSHQLYFACDETQAGHFQHKYIQDGEFKYPAFTQQSFNYWDGGPVLGAVPMKATGYQNALPNFPPIAKIKGMVYKITVPELIKLDSYKENTVQFQRERIRLIVPHRALKWVHDREAEKDQFDFIAENSLGLTKERVAIIRAWMYIGRPEYWDKVINAFDFSSVPTHMSNQRRWCPEYYRLPKPTKKL